MSPKELKEFIDSRDMTLTETAELFGVTHGAVSLWLSGKRAVPPLVAKCIRLFIAYPGSIGVFK